MRAFTNPGIHLALACGLAAACAPKPAPQPTEAELVARGRTLVYGGACHDCHTPKVFTATGMALDTARLLSGHPAGEPTPTIPAGVMGQGQWAVMTTPGLTAWAGPWGVSYAANLTPHATGLASFTPDVFIATIRNGKHAGVGRSLLPPMPWQMYKEMSDEDLRAIFAYLRSLPPISNTVPAPIPPRGEGR